METERINLSFPICIFPRVSFRKEEEEITIPKGSIIELACSNILRVNKESKIFFADIYFHANNSTSLASRAHGGF